MRRIHPGYLVKARTLTPSSHVRRPRFFRPNFRVSTSVVSERHQSSHPEGLIPSTWTQHTLTEFQTFPNRPPEFAKATELIEPQLAYIAFGSNVGDRIHWIERACNEMKKKGIKILRTSCLWETDPMYVLDQEKFLNGACEVETFLEPMQLLDTLQGIERLLGRQKLIDKGPRNIDLDILLYGQEVIDTERLKVPHPLMFEREFVLRPLSELIPGKALNPASPWNTTTDYLNSLPPSLQSEMTTVTPLSDSHEPIRALSSKRKTLIMAIMNFTPDSFSNDKANTPNKNLELPNLHLTAKLTTERGAHIFDIGGQSSAPQSESTTAEEETTRAVVPIKLLRDTGFQGLISIDTYRSYVARAAVNAGADIINDISAGQMDKGMLSLMARTGKTVCLMHMRGTPASMQQKRNTDYSPLGLIPSIANELLERVDAAQAAGIRRWRIILDPGIGFAKLLEHNVEILRRLDELRDWPGLRGLPWLVGASRKGFIGKITRTDVPAERTWGTAATVAAAIQGGADIVRVHDVRQQARVAMMADAIWRY